MKLIDEINLKYKSGDTLTRLVMINCAVFCLVLLTVIVLTLFTKSSLSASDIFQYPLGIHKLVARPWTIVTAPFTSWGICHLLFNMVCLYWLGGIFMERGTANSLRGLYILGALAAMVCYSALGAVTDFEERNWPESIPLASASILAICTALAFQTPDREEKLPLLGNVKIKWIVIALGIIDVAMLPHMSPPSDLAHLGAAFMGWLFQDRLRKGRDITKPLTDLYVKICDIIDRRMKRQQ